MWSRLTEYAGSVAEIVAPPADGSEQRAPTAELGDEIWSRFANIVAPAEGASATSSSHKGDHGHDDDEQERYISELERALLQKKKQNELLEQQIEALQAQQRMGEGGNDAPNDTKEKLLEEELSTLATQLEAATRAVQDAEARATENEGKVAKNEARLQEQVATLQQRVVELSVQCRVQSATLQGHRVSQELQEDEADASQQVATNDQHQRRQKSVTIFPVLVQTALVLSNAVSTDAAAAASLEVGNSEEAVAKQLLELAEAVRGRMHRHETELATLHATLASFLSLHVEKETAEAEDSSAAGDDGLTAAQVQHKLGVLSHRLSKGKSDAQEIIKLHQKLQTTQDHNDKQSRTIQALQTQLAGVQASKLQNDATLVDRESDMMDMMEKRDQIIASLQASEEKLKQTLAQLRQELDDAHHEAEKLDKVCRLQQDEIQKLEKKSDKLNDLQLSYDKLQVRANELDQNAHEYEQGYLALLQEAETMQRQNENEKAQLVATAEAQVFSSETQSLYDLEARLATCEADKVVAVQDTERLQSELDALDQVLLQFHSDHKHQRERVLELEQALAKAAQDLSQAQRARAASIGSGSGSGVSEEDFRRVMDVLSKRTQECEQLREALESFGRKFSSKADVLDKQIAAQLVVSYLESEKKHDVLELMARMMGFSEDQKRRAGILEDGTVVVPGNGGGGLFASIFGLQPAGGGARRGDGGGGEHSGGGDVDVDGKSLGDLWSNFLIDEAKR